MSGVLGWEDFIRHAEQFLELSSKLQDDWTMVWVKNEPGYGYLRKRTTKSCSKLGLASKNAEDETPISKDDNNTCSVTFDTVLTYEYHVIYNSSYSVPVLYMCAWTNGGRTLTLDEIWNAVPNVHQTVLGDKRWQMLTQQEHPLLCRPFYALHPCQTENLMKQIGSDNRKSNYLVTFLSTVGPVVGLELDLKYALLMEPTT